MSQPVLNTHRTHQAQRYSFRPCRWAGAEFSALLRGGQMLVNGGRNPPLNGGGCFPGTIFEQRASKKSRSGVKGKRSLAKRILDAAKGQKTGAGCDLGRAHKSAFSPPFNGGFASPLTGGQVRQTGAATRSKSVATQRAAMDEPSL
jgi:hypothetical protein